MVKAWLFPLLIAALLLIGLAGRVRVYESAIAGAREGLEVAVRIVPYLVAILVAVAMFRASGALDLLIRLLDPLTSLIGIPGEVLPMALLRPLSGSGAFGVMSEILDDPRSGFLRRLSGQHAPGIDRDDLLRAHPLLRGRRASATCATP